MSNANDDKKNPITVITNEDGTLSFSGRSMNPTRDKNLALKPYGKQLLLYGFVFELRPTEEQVRYFNQTFGNARVVANDYHDQREAYYKNTGKTLSVSEYKKGRLKELKAERPYLENSDKFALESAIENMDAAFANYIKYRKALKAGVKKRKVGFPKHVSRNKPNGNKYATKNTNGNIRIALEDGDYIIRLPKVGNVKLVMPNGKALDKIMPGNTRILRVTVSKDNGRYYASVSFERIIDLIEDIRAVSRKMVFGGDLGIKDLLIYGNSDATEKESNPRLIRLHEKRLRRLQRKMARRHRVKNTRIHSNNWEKARKAVAKEQRKIANQRKDLQHKLSTKIARKCLFFIAEDLNVKGMLKNRRLAKAISEVGWGGFLTKLAYKLQRKGGGLVKIDHWFPSSQLCSSCGHKNPDVKNLAVREWICPVCGKHHDRDENAKENILAEGIRIMKEELGILVIDEGSALVA